MSAKAAAKIVAKIIKMYRAAYVSAAGIGTSGGVNQAIMKSIMGAKMFQSKPRAFVGKMDADTIMKLIQAGKFTK